VRSRHALVVLALVVSTLAAVGGSGAAGAQERPAGPYWRGWDIARGFDLAETGGGTLIDGWGGLHRLGSHPSPQIEGYVRGWDIVVGLAFADPAGTAGYRLDRWGGLHRFGGTPPATGVPYTRGRDTYRSIDLLPGSARGVVLAASGELFRVNGAVVDTSGAPRSALGAMRGVALLPDGSGGYTLEANGRIHAWGAAEPAAGPRWPWPIARDLRLDPGPDPRGGWVLDGWGGLHRFAVGVEPVPTDPTIRVETVVSGLTIPWDLDVAADGTLVFTERSGRLAARLPNGTVRTLARPSVYAVGESGLTSVELDPGFATNRRLYTCQANASPREVRVVAWTVDAGWTTATPVPGGPLVSGIPLGSGRHGGCQLRFGPDGHLWIGTGDAAMSTTPQSTTSLGGKVLRVDPRTGAGVAGNPFLGRAGDDRIVTLGHRNVQGLARRPGTAQMWSIEHGPDRDDEINLLRAGANYGWRPSPGYDERVPMTFAGATPAVWSSGAPTVATSAGVFLEGRSWGTWEGALAVTTLKGRHVRLVFLDGDRHWFTLRPPELDGRYGRLRGAELGPDGALYLTTSNGGGTDRILRVSPG